MLAVVREELRDGDVRISSWRARVVRYSDDLVVVFRLKENLNLKNLGYEKGVKTLESKVPC